MSLLSKIVKSVAPAAATFGKLIPGIGTAVSLAGTAATAYYAAKAGSAVPAAPAPMALPAFPGVGGFSTAGLGSSFLPAVGRVAGTAIRVGAAGARRVASSAAAYCRKHPGWCQTIGGIAAVEAMIQNGQLPAMKSRRGRGITATELKNFKRVARFTSKYCAPVRKAMSSRALRGKSCR